MKFFETHAHYNDKAYENNLEDVLKKCKEANVDKIINIGYNKESSIKSIELSKKYDYMYAVIGVHPHDVEKANDADIEKIYNECDIKERIVAIGEIGLDYAFVKDNKEKQKEYCRTEAYQYLRISRSSFDAKVNSGVLPKGHKVPGQGPVWFKKDLDEYLKKYDNKKKTLSTDIRLSNSDIDI